jgi:hypothetical protein
MDTLTPNNLNNFTGTEQWYRWSILFPWALMTDGTMYLYQNGAGWLIDAICSHQTKAVRQITPQFWTLVKTGNTSADLILERDEGDVILTQKIPFTDFPLDNFDGKFRIWASWDSPDAFILILPSEY